MSAIVYGAVKQRGPKEGSLHHTLMVLADESDDFGFCCPSVESIAHGSRCSERQAIRRLQRLEREGWIRVQRKVFRGDMANAYFINLSRLGVVPTGKSRRSPLWTNVQRLLKALEAHDKVSLLNGVLCFEKTPESVDVPESGDLFDPDFPSDTMSPGKEAENASVGPVSTLSDLVLGQNAAEGPGTASTGVENADSAGDILSHDKCHPRHVTSDIEGQPFNSLTRYYPVTASTSPTPPHEEGFEALAVESEDKALDDRDMGGWSLFKTRLKFGLRETPLGAGKGRFTEIRKGEDDYDAAFRDWRLVGRRDERDRIVLVTRALDLEATRQGLKKYSTRLAETAAAALRNVRGRKIEFEVEGEGAGIDLAASAEPPKKGT